MTWPQITISRDRRTPCPICNQIVVASPPIDGDVSAQVKHYVSVHNYREPATEEIEKVQSGKTPSLTLIHP
jgi:hypothetical protein